MTCIEKAKGMGLLSHLRSNNNTLTMFKKL
jgi:hypothetical protein